MQYESQTRDNKSCSTSTHYRQRTSKVRIDRSSPRDLRRHSRYPGSARREREGEGGEDGEGWKDDGTRTVTLSFTDLSPFRIFPDRKKSTKSDRPRGRERERETAERRREKKEKRANLRNGSSREKAGSLYRAATTTGLQKQTPHLLC